MWWENFTTKMLTNNVVRRQHTKSNWILCVRKRLVLLTLRFPSILYIHNTYAYKQDTNEELFAHWSASAAALVIHRRKCCCYVSFWFFGACALFQRKVLRRGETYKHFQYNNRESTHNHSTLEINAAVCSMSCCYCVCLSLSFVVVVIVSVKFTLNERRRVR